tara:strand:- start:218 stop:2323 length:2106 start_codon:yes stop_codon:yes gene_type:complete
MLNPVYAQSLEATHIKTQKSDSGVPPSKTATGLRLEHMENPQIATVITRKEIEGQNTSTVAEALDGFAGLSTMERDGNSFWLGSRGVSAKMIFIDGMPTYTAKGGGFNDGKLTMDSALIEQVEVVKGGNAMLRGVSNDTATVNIQRKKPTAEFQSSVTAGVGSWHKKSLVLDVSGSLTDNKSVRGRFIHSLSGKQSEQDRYKEKRGLLYGVIEADITSKTLLTTGVDYFYFSPKGNMVGGGLPLYYDDKTLTDFDRSVSIAPSWTKNEIKTWNAFANLEHTLNTNWSLSLSYAYHKSDLDFPYIWPKFGLKKGTYALPSGTLNQTKKVREAHTVKTEIEGHFNAFGQDQQVVLGLQYHQMKDDNITVRGREATTGNIHHWDNYNVSLGDFTQSSWDFPEPIWSDDIAYTDYTYNKEWGAYISSQIRFTEALSLISGVRFNRWSQDAAYINPQKPENNSVKDITEKFKPTYYVGATYRLFEPLALYGSYNTTFMPHDKRDINRKLLEPEEAQNFEAGLKLSLLQQKFDVSLGFFQTKRDNFAVEAGEDSDKKTYYKGVEGATVRGYELEARGQLTDAWFARLSATTFTHKDRDGEHLQPEFPRQSASLYTEYDFSGSVPGVQAGFGVKWHGKISHKYSTEPEYKQGSYTLVNLMTRYHINEHFMLQANVNNLLDKEYKSALLFARYMPGKGREYGLTATYTF